jgi:uncharacterized repeat protein (TIGR03943 family)
MTAKTVRSLPRFLQILIAWLDVLALAAWGIVLLKLWLAGQLYLLIHPNYIGLTVCASLGLLAIAGCEAWRIVRQQRSRNSTHITLLMPTWSSSLLLGVAIIALIVNPRPFASEKAIHRGVTDSTAATRTVPQAFRASNRPEERTLVEWVRTLNAYPEPDAYKGQKVKVTGFVVHAKDLPDNIFLITRFVITCCAADVYPVSLPVKVGQSRANYPPDKWFTVEGQMVTEELLGKRQLVIQAANLTAVPEPKNPYDY